ncbi:hypothetical protein [Frondihabitans australicus]|uniref:Uncharacterized protein n=1 Tax=Frondihabitans australicus TaxID=386892 RepID=A0A495ICB5_9MICO|nr:hypothetical protein [Frondihabitans australicus]RKR73647.1 hypothetical protein C8E83_0741 [Frondihabitans australicus]
MDPVPLALRSTDLVHAGFDDRDVRDRAARGQLARVTRGSYLPSEDWRSLDARQKYVSLIHAVVSGFERQCAVSHWSAAAVWGLPVPDEWPRHVEVIDPARSTAQLASRIRRRPGTLRRADVLPRESTWITSAARTATDIALTGPFEEAVLVFDHGLRLGLFTTSDIERELAGRPGARRSRSAASALGFADGAAEYAGESFSRCGMAARGLLMPTLQEESRRGWRLIAKADFWWESSGIVGEFDGDWKYSDPRWLRGRTPAEAIADEKRRQNELAAHPRVRTIVRWDYAVARNPDELARRLLAAGVPRVRPPAGRRTVERRTHRR